jgi:hypothetical protein
MGGIASKALRESTIQAHPQLRQSKNTSLFTTNLESDDCGMA